MNNGLSILVEGASGSGKSWFAGSVAEAGFNPYVVALRPKELSSYLYQKHGLDDPNGPDSTLIHDPKWAPTMDSFESDSYEQLMREIWKLQEDEEHDAVIFDPITDINAFIKRAILKQEGVGQVRHFSDGLALWGEVRELWGEVVNAITSLQYAPTPKHVIAVVHSAVASDEDEKKKDVEFFGHVVPAIQGSFKTLLESEFQIAVHTDIKHEYDQKAREQVERYVIETRANPNRHNKVSIAPALESKTLPNDWSALMEAVEDATNAG